MDNPYSNAVNQLKKVNEVLKLDSSVIDRLSEPDRILQVSIPLKMDDGSIKTFIGFRSQHNNARGPYKGGIRFHENVSRDEVAALSMWMTWKCSTTTIPYGGGKGGIIVDPNKLSQNELERLSRGYVQKIFEFIGTDTDIPAPDVNTDGQIMAWMTDEYSKIKREWTPGAFTGKPLNLGGSLGREKATGNGGVIVMDELLIKLGKKPVDTTVAIQGFGNVGFWFAKLAAAKGYKIVALSDSKGAVFNADGIDVNEAKKYKDENRHLKGFSNEITNEELLELEVDVLVPSALESVINKENADKIKAKIIIEMANGPVTPEADSILFDKEINVIPDVLANAGGVTVSYFEWVQNKMGYYWSEEEVDSKLYYLMKQAFSEAYSKYQELNLSFRESVYIGSVKRVAEALIKKGL